mgnify:CR=1 FL=1|tara:strand:- start:971 stop:1330 length:360 start_codon:yes stop_codon:yes gene_type:complete
MTTILGPKKRERAKGYEKMIYDSYFNYQNFSSDEPTHQINNSPWYLKYEEGLPAFFFRYENTFKQMSVECFLVNAAEGRTYDLSNWQQQVEAYFNQPMEDIKKCLHDAKLKMKNSSTSP